MDGLSLYASCLEAVGLHPLLITTAGHIFTGVWLEDRMFPECVQDDASLITKRLASGVNEIAVVETTAVTTGKDRSFDDARSIGEQTRSKSKIQCEDSLWNLFLADSSSGNFTLSLRNEFI